MGFSFHNPGLLLLLLLVPVYIFFYWRQQKGVAVRFSSTRILKRIGPTPSIVFRHILAVLKCLAIALLVIALARPQRGIKETEITTEGIDIILTLDVSTSMLAEDFKIGGKRYNRLEVAKRVIRDFIEERSADRIGLVVYAGQAYSQCPLTVDYGVLLDLLDKVDIGMIDDGTAIGTAIATSLNRLRESEAKSKVIILLTDGVNNAGKIDPQTAAEMAKTLDVKIYTIGVGTKGPVPYPVKDFRGRTVYREVTIPIDDESLEKIAQTTGGEYFRATDTGSLEKIFETIDELEKTPSEATIYTEYHELFAYFAFLGLFFILAEVILRNTRFRSLP